MQRMCSAVLFQGVVLVATIIYFPSRITAITDSNQGHRRETPTGKLIDYILSGSDSRVRPNVYGAPVNVTCSVFVQSLGPLSAQHMEFNMEIYFRMEWMDGRLSFSNQTESVILHGNHVQNVWIPDVYFTNAKQSEIHDVLTANRWLRIEPSGSVYMSVRLSLRLFCPMSLQHYPMDEPECLAKVASYSHSQENLQLIWNESSAIQLNEDLLLPEYILKKDEHMSCKLTYIIGEYSCLAMKFRFKRYPKSHILNDYIVSSCIVIVAWLAFWIHKDAVPARIALGVTTLLTMTTQLGNSSTGTASVSYLKALDIWNTFCMIMVFSALIEYAAVNVLSRREKSDAAAEAQAPANRGKDTNNCCLHSAEIEDLPVDTVEKEKTTTKETSVAVRAKKCLFLVFMTSEGLDTFARAAYPMAFILFNIIYWIRIL